MNNRFKIALLSASLLTVPFLTGCGDKVEVPPAHKGKILGSSGYLPDTIPPSKFRLDYCIWYCDKLVIVEVSDSGLTKDFKLVMPKDNNITMEFTVLGTIAVADDEKSINTIMSKIPADPVEDQDYQAKISFDDVYRTYGEPILQDIVSSVLSQYRIDEIGTNRTAINSELFKAVDEAFENVPLRIVKIGLGEVTYPPTVLARFDAAAEREIEIQTAESDRAIMLVQQQAALEQAEKDLAVRRIRAQAVAEENAIVSQGITDAYITYKTLEVLEALAESGASTFVPMEALGTIGLQNKIFQDK